MSTQYIEYDENVFDYIENIFSKDTGKLLLLVSLLNDNKEGIEIEKLSFKTSLERRSIYKYVKKLQELIKPDIFFSRKGKYYFGGNLIDYRRIIVLIVKDEPMINLAKIFLTQNQVNILEFCSDNFLSEATFMRYITKANKILIPFGVRLRKNNNIYAFGSEANIRYCLVSFFWRIFQGVNWPFDSMIELKMHRLAAAFPLIFQRVSYGKKQQLYYYLAIFILRAQSGYKISEEELPEYFNELLNNNEIYKKFLDGIMANFNVDRIEIGFIFLNLYIFPESYKYIQNTSETLDVLSNYGKNTYSSINKFIGFVKEIHPNFTLTSEKRSDFVAMVIASRIFVDIYGPAYFNTSAIHIFNYLGRNFPNLLPSISKGIWKFEKSLSENSLKALTLRYAQAYIMEFPPCDFEPKLYILLDTDFPMFLDKIIINEVNHLLSSKFNYEWVTLEKKMLPDLLLSSGMVDDKFSKIPQKFIKPELSMSDKEEIIQVCRDLLKSKN